MKKISITIIALLAFSFLSATALATSGECSYHGGVNCSVGASAQGYAVCNDGWTSGVLFSNTDECQVSVPRCTYPVQPSCSLSEIQQEQQSALGSNEAQQARGGLLGSSFGAAQTDAINNSYSLQYSQCQTQWTAYQSQLTGYNACIQNQSTILNQQAQSGVAAGQLKLNAFCVQYNGTGSVWSASLSADAMGAQCTQSTDQIFQKYFKLAMATLPPQYQGVVDPTVIEPLTLNPANANKTFSQIILEAYPNVMSQTSTSATSSPAIMPVTTITPSVATFAINQNLRAGASGNDVINLQKFLESKNFLTLPIGTTEGYFGSLTKQALVSFQTSAGLPTTGYCGPMTRAVINVTK